MNGVIEKFEVGEVIGMNKKLKRILIVSQQGNKFISTMQIIL